MKPDKEEPPKYIDLDPSEWASADKPEPFFGPAAWPVLEAIGEVLARVGMDALATARIGTLSPGQQQRVLVLEIPIDGVRRHAGRLGDAPHRRRLIAVLHEQLTRSGHQLRFLFGLGFGSLVDGHG